ncbi:GerAB/ArcD/ProY family transporter [Bacillus mesophilum]|uniref:GerAB/ArcD/ProY family transporter n=1 Tax=Bacillus mesophilum TaxID=1071718 RepID=A0A7V7UVQ8_9BACI|nr:GerAB/ArcD/ProY family transporter [Bacillus mesophilum]KAB2333431.1 GerAB/ArcD/ProY family transporter [Bacillus mesophilum]
MEQKEVQVSPFLVFFLIHGIQVGVGILGFQRIIIKSAGNDGWIAVIAAGIIVSLVIAIQYNLLNRHKNDIFQIQKELFGKFIGSLFGLIWIVNWIVLTVTVLRSFIEVVEVWVFSTINIYLFALIFVILIYYCLTGGFRVVTGICVLGTIIPLYLYLTFLFPLKYTHMHNLLPIWNHSIKEMSVATKDMALSYLGFSTLLMYYPYIKHAKSSQKWAHYGNILTCFIYLFLMIITIGYFSEKQISHHIWATLSLWKIVELPFVERFEYIGITSWVLMILPNICLFVWAAAQGIGRIIKIKQKKVVLFILLIVYILTVLINGRDQIDSLNHLTANLGLYMLFGYIPIICLYSYVRSKFKEKKK